MTPFQQKVYLYCSRIPEGRVASYSDIAHAMGSKAYRAVGNALNKNPFAPKVPCHRVVSSDGSIGGFASGAMKKIELLKSEGIKVKGGKIQDFEKVRFSISAEL